MRKKPARGSQLTFERLWEKKRRKRKRRPGAGVPHRRREEVDGRTPCHVTLKLFDGLESLRRDGPMAVIREAFRHARQRPGRLDGGEFRLVHFSIEIDHVHLLVEGKDRLSISRGIQGLAIRIAKGPNRLWRRLGSVFKDRFHARALRSPREVRNALRYVLSNGRRHQQHLDETRPDPCSSGPAFDGWMDYCPERSSSADSQSSPGPANLIARAKSWLLTTGWRRHGLIALAETPGSAGRKVRGAKRSGG